MVSLRGKVKSKEDMWRGIYWSVDLSIVLFQKV